MHRRFRPCAEVIRGDVHGALARPPGAGPSAGGRLLTAAVGIVVAGAVLVGLEASRAASGYVAPHDVRAHLAAARDTVDADSIPALDPAALAAIFGEADPDTLSPSDSLDVLTPPDTLRLAGAPDSLVVPPPDTGRVDRILPPFRADHPLARVEPRRQPLTPSLGNYWNRAIELDSVEARYVVREHVGGADVRIPQTLGLDAYRDVRRKLSVDDNFRDLSRQRMQRQQQRSGLGFGFDIPGGAGAGLRTIFGSDQVDLRVHGQTNVNVGFSYRANEQQQAATGQGGRLDPDFGQELGLSIVGTIGDKLEVNVNYDTQNDFDFQNQVRLTYTGYEDDIIQRIEAGNVFLPVESDLIRGGQRLFGLKTDLQIGGLALTAVASQQDAESDELVIEGGSQTTPFQLHPTNYEDNAHFYLGYYFYNRWDAAHATPPNPVFGEVRSFETIEVYKFDVSLTSPNVDDDVVAGVALVDLGENEIALEGGRAYFNHFLEAPPAPGPAVDRYNQAALNALREGGFTSNGAARQRLASHGVDTDVLGDADLVVSRFKRLRPNQDYTIDETFGTISLNQPLNESDVIAVAYTYRRADGSLVRVGDVGQGSGSGNVDEGPRIVLKLLRPANLQPEYAAWDLTMRNIYRVGGRGLDPDGFEMQIYYAGSGQTPQRTLPGVDVGQGQTLLQTLGLDRVTQDGTPGSDDLFDFLPNYTIRPGTGRVIFPYREPFGERLRKVIQGDGGVNVRLDGLTQEEAISRYVFSTLYTAQRTTAERETDKNVFRLTGSSRGTVQEFYDLGFAVVEGSVEVMSGGSRLNPGTDYTVDYATGSVTITNPAYLTPGRDIRINFERQQFSAIQKKTLLGLRAQYDFTDRLAIGGTWMRLVERPMTDKFRIGEEPIANSIWGLDARYEADPRWITRVVDAIPLIQTSAPSRFEFRGEFAQLNPGHPQTIAFDRSRDQLLNMQAPNPRDFNDDELRGISYIDDFEGSENTFSLLQPTAWRLGSGPTGNPTEGIAGAGPDSVRTYLSDLPGGGSDITRPGLRSNWRGLFAWYAVVPGMYESGVLSGLPRTHASRPVPVREVFPERELDRNQPQVLTTLDLYFDPRRRGPYNFNAGLGSIYSENPQKVWGGMMQRLPDGYRDFEARNNIEFVEFIFSPFGGRMADQPVDPDARLVIDLGRVSEDVLPDGELNSEDGLLVPGSLGPWGRRGTGPTDGIINVNQATRRTEDLGLNGLASGDLCRAAADNGTPYEVCEEQHYSAFLEYLRATLPADDPRLARAEMNPSADEYRSFQDDAYFQNQSIWPGGAVLQERFSQFYAGLQGNSLEAQTQLAGRGTPGNSRMPDTEDLYLDGSLNTLESFFRYELPLDPVQLRNSPFFVEEIHNSSMEGAAPWYVVRIPVRTDDKVAVGGITGFREVSAIRMWTQGHSNAATLRFAKLELVGSQWLKSAEVTRAPVIDITEQQSRRGVATAPIEPNIFVATINTDQNPSRYRVPNGTVRSFTRDPTSGNLLPNREQALVFLVENLMAGAQGALFKPYTRSLDLTKYSNLRMFVHGSGFESQDSLRVFMRLGANETDDYYEIEQPIYAWEPPDGMTVLEYERLLSGGEAISSSVAAAVSDSLWQTNVPVADGQGGVRYVDRNSINIAFAALNILKVERDLARDPDNPDAPFPLNEVFARRVADFVETDVGNFAPDGAVLRIKGTPSIQNISTVVMGVRKARGGSPAPANAEFWFNEMRVSGYEEAAGWSAYARANLRMADFADVNVRYARQTDNFGELGSGLGDRTFRNEESFQVSANVNMHRFIPERFGWQIPVNVTVQNRLTTPRFSPRRGDITVDQEIEQIRQDEDLTEDERRREIEEVRAAAQTHSLSRTVRVPISKRGSNSPWLRYTLDGLQLTYTNTLDERRSPQRAFDDASRWSTALQYRLQVPGPQTVRPMWFLEDLPVLSLLGNLRLNLLPQSVRLSADANRSINENQDRARRGLSQDPVRRALEQAAEDDRDLSRYLRPINRRHTFGHQRTVEVQYNPFGFLSTSFSSRTRQSLDAAGVDPSFDLLLQRLDDPSVMQEFPGMTFAEVFAVEQDADGNYTHLGPGFAWFGLAPGDEGFDDLATNPNSFVRNYGVESMDIRPVTTVLGDVFSGERPIRTDAYQQTFNVSMQSPIDRVQALSWLRITPITYNTSFNWGHIPLTQFGLEEERQVASLSSQAGIRGGVNLRMRELMGKIPLWKRLEESQREAEQARRQADQRRQADLTAYRQAQERVREAEAALRAAEREAAETGEPVPDDLRAALDAAVAADTLARPAAPLPVPNPLSLARRTFIALTSPRDISLTYDGTFASTIGNVDDPGFSLFSTATGTGPSLGYRLGFDRYIPADADTRFFGSPETPFSFDDTFRDEHRLGARTSIEFSQALRVDLQWDTNFNQRETHSYSYNFDEETVVVNYAEHGRGQSTVMGFGGSYDRLFELQLDRLLRAGVIGDGAHPDSLFTDALTNNAVADDFRSAFTTGLGTFGTGGFFAVPLPNWQLTYSGLSNWPIIRSLAQSATLRHGYSATYDVGYRSFSGEAETRNLSLNRPEGGAQSLTLINEEIQHLRVDEPRLNQRFQPLVGVDLNIRGGIQANVNYNTSATYALSTVNARMTESNTEELAVRLSFTRTGFRLPLPFIGGRRLNNQLRFSLVLSKADNLQRAYTLRDDIQAHLANVLYQTELPETFRSPLPEATTRITIEPQLSYTVSNAVTASFFVRYERFEAENSRIPTTSNINGGFNFRVSFSN